MMGRKPVGYLLILCVIALVGCSTKKYLPKIFNPDTAKANVNQTPLYYEKAGKGIPFILSPETMPQKLRLTQN